MHHCTMCLRLLYSQTAVQLFRYRTEPRVLTSCKLTGNPETVAAYHTKEENYYFSQASGVESLAADDGAQGHVRIYGNLAHTLGFAPGDALDQRALTNLLAGKDAAGAQVTRAHKVNGIDLTFSAPKSVSVAGLLTVRDPRIIQAHDRAVLETMSEIERHCAGTRPTATERVKTGNLAYVTVRDGFNRDHDPHLHTHVVVANMTALGDKILAVDGRQIMRRDFNKMWGAMYRAKLAAYLNEAGYSVSYTKKGELRMDAVPLEVERAFSGRRAQIQAKKAAGALDMEAWRRTRKEKDAEVEKADVVAGWRERLANCQPKTAEQTRQDTLDERETWFKSAHWSVEARQELAGERTATEVGRWHVAARRATDRSARVTAEAIVTEYLTELCRAETWDPITYAEAEQRLAQQVNAGNIVRTDDGYYTTWELTRADRECVAAPGLTTSLALADAGDKLAAYATTQQKEGRRTLSPVQQAAARAILASTVATVVVQGDAGAGKTTMLRAVREIAQSAGWEVVGVAVQGVAARKLQEESAIPSTTMAAYIASERAAGQAARPPRLVALDEASMADSRGLSELLRRAEECGDKVVLVGDRNQIQSVGAGKPFERLVERAEASGELLSLTENYRQRDPALRRAVDLARAGMMRETIDHLDELGKLDEIEDTHLRRLEVAKEYAADTLILAGTRDGKDALNKLIRQRLLETGELEAASARVYTLRWADEDGIKQSTERQLAAGDRVTFLQNEYKRYDVRNGEVGVVTSTSKTAIGVRLADGREVAIDLGYYAALDYGYALTTYKSQGQTYDRVIVEADTRYAHLQDQRNSYVQITRARNDVRIYTDDREALREAASILSEKRDTLDLKQSLSHAAFMERRVREEALGVRARQEAGAKILQAEANAAMAAQRLIGEVMGRSEDESKTEKPADSASSREAGQDHRSPDPAPPGTASRSQAETRVSPSSSPNREASAPFSFDPSVTAHVRDFKALFGDMELTGTAEILRGELRRESAGGKAEEEAVTARLDLLDVTTAAFMEGADVFVKAPEQSRRINLERFRRDIERRVMLTGEAATEDVRNAYQTIWESLPVQVHNDHLVARAGESEVLRAGWIEQLKSVELRLNERSGLDIHEKHRVADYLALPSSVTIFATHLGRVDYIIAAGLVGSRTRDIKAAVLGLSIEEAGAIRIFESAISGGGGQPPATQPGVETDGPSLEL